MIASALLLPKPGSYCTDPATKRYLHYPLSLNGDHITNMVIRKYTKIVLVTPYDARSFHSN